MKVALGTVQFGLNYGITNQDGQVPLDAVGDILTLSAENGIRVLDTAIAYGESEKVLGNFDLSGFDVVSKIPSLKNAERTIDVFAQESLERLRIDQLYGLLMHDENDACGENFEALHTLKGQGLVAKVGASFYTPEKALAAVESGVIDLIQIPANQLDARFERCGVYMAAQRRGVEVHVRSVFLQGLLAVSCSQRPERFKSHPDLLRFDTHCEHLNMSPIELALDFVLRHPTIAQGVIGCTSRVQLEQIISAYHHIEKMGTGMLPSLTSDDEILLNPSKW